MGFQILFLNSNLFAFCENCISGETSRVNNQLGGTAASPTSVIFNNNNDIGWAVARPNSSTFARFNNPGFYRWSVSGNNTVELKGLIVSSGVTLEVRRSNANETPIFDIEGGCILVENNATLIFSYYTEMQNLKICVKSGGTLIFDSDSPGQSDGDRDKYLFNNINITVEPGSSIRFGDAEIEQRGNIDINGYNGNPCILNDDGSFSPPPPVAPPNVPNILVEIPPMTQAELNLFCRFLSEGTRIAPLPVEYLYFKSNFLPQHRAVQLIWATAKEWENSHFEIQRSVNGVRNWEKIGEMKGAGWSEMPVEYLFKDEMLPLTGGNVFYRLKQVDFNGDFAYSEVVSARIPTLQFTNGVWRVFPNPSNGDALRIELLDRKLYNGEALTANLITPAAGRRSLLGIDSDTIAEEVLELLNANGKGVYVLEIAWSNNIEHIKILKQ